MTIRLGAADLSYLLQQVNILNDYSQLTSPIDPNGVREVSGSNNNLVGGFTVDPVTGNLIWTGSYDAQTGLVTGDNVNADWGQADTDFLRLFFTNHPTSGTSYGITYETARSMAVPDANGLSFGDAGYVLTLKPDAMSSIIVTGEGTTGGTSPRTITQLITSSDVDPTSPTYNPAAAAAMNAMGGEPVGVANTVVGSAQTAFIPNPGILGGVPYNEFFVAFGQFFDHGLDFISKGGGFVLIPLSPNDPLYDPAATGPMANMMMLNRASLANPASDFVVDSLGNATLAPGVTPQFNNNTGLMIDQSQTYGSHASVNVLVRQYDASGNVTGRLIDGSEDGSGSAHALATWADMKVNAARIGIELIDTDVLDVPLIKADAVGRLLTSAVEAELGLDPGVAFEPQSTYLFRSDETLVETAARYGVAVSDIEGFDPFYRDAAGNVLTSNQPILADMGNGASPMGHGGALLPSLSSLQVAGTYLPTMVAGVDYYDDAFLAAHQVSGDGRVNENIGLTAVHHVFHEEHNIQANNTRLAAVEDAIARGDLSGLNGAGTTAGWLAVDVSQTDFAALLAANTTVGANPGDPDIIDYQAIANALTWDGEKIYQAARIITESEYNHIAIDQYVTGLYPALPEFVAYSADINLSVSLEFAQAVFRLGHSQLSETMQLALPNASGSPGDPGYIPDAASTTNIDLFDAFLNPAAYEQYSAAGIISGLLNQQGNEIDEYVTAALQQSLVGVPLDLAALNIARGRDVGLPTLNELRQQAFEGLMQNGSNNSNGSGIAPYTSWADFGGSMRNPDSLVNFIAAYGHDNLTGNDWGINEARAAYEAGSMTLQELRQTAQDLLDAYGDATHARHADAVQFMQGGGTPVYSPGAPGNINGWVYEGGSGDLGFWDIDLWIGGLAEQPLFDGPLGTTFSLIVLDFAQRMQDGDRFYYLYRMPVGHHLGDQIIGEQFSDLVMRTTGLENIGDAFGSMTAAYYLDSGVDGVADEHKTDVDANNSIHDYFNAIYERLPDVTRNIVVGNNSFEVDSLATPTNTAPSLGTFVAGAPTGWDLRSTFGTIIAAGAGVLDPVAAAIPAMGHDGAQVAYLAASRSLTQDIAAPLVAGNSYTFSANIGNRANTSNLFQVQFRLVDSATGVVIAQSTAFTASDVANGTWANLVWDTGPIGAAHDGKNFRIEIANQGASEVIFIDNVNLSVTEPGGSANDGHILVVGGTGNDFIKGALGDDYLYGGDDNDVLEGAQGNDHLYGGDGDDWITDYENDDFIHGGAGNDYISAGPGVLDTAHGGEGDDEVHGGDGIDEVFGDDGDDILFGEGDTDLMEGGDGNDFMDGGDSVDEMFAGNGNDWLRGGVGDDHMNGGSGNDLMEGGGGPVANDGDRYFGDQGVAALPLIEFNGDGTIGNMDIASYENLQTGVTASLQNTNATGTNSNLLDSYALVDGVVGSATGDLLEGGDLDAVATNGWNNQLIGGGGSDRLTGLGDDAGVVTNATVDSDPDHYVDWIFGDAVVVRNDLWTDLEATMFYKANQADIASGVITTHALSNGDMITFLPNWGGRDIGIAASATTTGEMRVLFTSLDGSTDLGHILGEDGVGASDVDTAVYRGNRADYTITAHDISGAEIADPVANAASVAYVRVVDNRATVDPLGNPVTTDGIDHIVGIEMLAFADGTIDLATALASIPGGGGGGGSDQPATGELGIVSYTDGGDRATLTAANTLADPDLVSAENPTGAIIDYQWQELVGGVWQNNGETAQDQVVEGGGIWRVAATYTDAFGMHTVASAETAVVGTIGAETLDGTAGPDIVLGLDGADTLNGGDDNDTLDGGAGGDTINGGAGLDTILGRGGADTISGGAGNDSINAGAGNDTIIWNVGDGTDRVNGGGGGGDELIVNGNGETETYDVIAPNAGGAYAAYAEAGRVVITRTVGGTTAVVASLVNVEELVFNLSASGGGDATVAAHGTFTGLISQNTITINANGGNVIVDISQMTSNEHVVLNTGGTYEIIGNGTNEVEVNGVPTGGTAPAADPTPTIVAGDLETYVGGSDGEVIVGTDATRVVYADGGDDIIMTGNGNTVVMAGGGADVVNSGDGNDIILGGADDDTVDSGAGNDKVWGDAGDDVILGGDGDDLVYGDEGADEIHGGAGNDRIEGGTGADLLFGDAGHDRFVFCSEAEADGDTVADFQAGDVIDVSFMDANGGIYGGASFTLLSATAFTAIGQLIVHFDASSNSTIVEGNTDDNATTAEFQLKFVGNVEDLLLQQGSIIN